MSIEDTEPQYPIYEPTHEDLLEDAQLRPGRPLMQRHLELCRMAAHGKTNKEIADKLGYTQGRVSILVNNHRIMEQTQLYRDRLFQVDTKTRMKELAPDALEVIDGILNDSNLDLKEKEKAAMWVIEKIDGKAAQQTDVNVQGGIGFFLDKLDQMKAQGETINVKPHSPNTSPASSLLESAEPEPTTLESTGKKEEAPTDEFTAWLNANLKEEA